ncbi:hypothetical protein FYJ72_04010 [Prevotella copri]|uniref:Uncharacterized protein n=1 Tax=Segatella copri TaxID=165179 RepID=A0A6I2TX96_9BACT|nr:hypothetical protein [Segatella copri]MST76868.1 hypothetical protein [Segatella copri]
MAVKSIHKNQSSGNKKPTISQREFARLWNLLLTKVRLVAKDANNFPATILTMDQNDEHVDDTLFVVERLSSDHEFIEEMTERTGSLISLVIEKWGGITIQAIKQNY